MKIPLLGILGSLLLLVPIGHTGKVTLKKDNRLIEGMVISRPETLTGKAVVTIRGDLDNKVYQFDLDEVAMIESATQGIQILNKATIVREGTSENAKVVRRFTAGMEFLVDRRQGDWVRVIPRAEGLKKDTGWIPVSALTTKLDLEAMREEGGAEALADIIDEGPISIESLVPKPEPTETPEAEPQPEPPTPEPESLKGSAPEPESSTPEAKE